MKRFVVILAGLASFCVMHAGDAMSRSSAADRDAIRLTVFNGDRVLVMERRTISLPAGESRLEMKDVARTVMPQTVALRSLQPANHLSVLEQNYLYDLLDPEALLQHYVGQDLSLQLREEPNGAPHTVPATLLAYNNQRPVWRIGGKIVTNPSISGYEFPELPESLHVDPALRWRLHASGGRTPVEFGYLATGMNWHADYIMLLDRTGKIADLSGWVTLNNKTGTRFANTTLQLIAGDVQLKNPQIYGASGLENQYLIGGMNSMSESYQMGEKTFAEYHLYTLPFITDIENNEQKQVTLLDNSGAAADKVYRLTGKKDYFLQQSDYVTEPQKVQVYYRLHNTEKNHLGIPLPKGIVRVYQLDGDGQRQFIGEDELDHTPKNEWVETGIGSAFDITAARKRTSYKRLDSCQWETSYEITLRNHKTSPVTVEVREPITGDWEIVEHSLPFEKTAAFAASFQVPLQPEEEKKLTYRVRFNRYYC